MARHNDAFVRVTHDGRKRSVSRVPRLRICNQNVVRCCMAVSRIASLAHNDNTT